MPNTIWKKYKELSIKDLRLWDENARFPEEYFNKSEEELIKYFLSNKKFKIKDFTKEIVKELDIPQFEELLVLKKNGFNIVLEGNRRLAVYKLLCNPKLAGNTIDEEYFREQNSTVKITDDFLLMVHITNDFEEGMRLIDRKHYRDNNEVSWTGTERSHFTVRRKKGINKDIFKVEMSKIVRKLDLPDIIKSGVLGKGYETTFWRIVEKPSAREKLGYTHNEDGSIKINDKDIFNDYLKTIVYNIWNKQDFEGNKIDSRHLNKSYQISDYLKKITRNDVEIIDKDVEEKKSLSLFGDLSNQKGTSSIYKKRRAIKYLSLINPKNNTPSVKSDKIIEVFKELQLIDVPTCSTATFALVRILTDITIKIFLDKKGYKFNNHGHLLIPGLQKNKQTLKEKMNYIANKYLEGELRPAVVALNEDLLTQNLNQVMHSSIFQASETQIRRFWKNLFPFLEFLWKEIINLEETK